MPISTLVDSVIKVSPLVINHQGQFPSVTISFNLTLGTALGQAVSAIQKAAKELGPPLSLQASFQGNAQAFGASLSSTPILIAAALFVIYLILGILYESLIHPVTIISTLPAAGLGALLLLMAAHFDLSAIAIVGIILLIGIVKKNGIMLVDFAQQVEQSTGRLYLSRQVADLDDARKDEAGGRRRRPAAARGMTASSGADAICAKGRFRDRKPRCRQISEQAEEHQLLFRIDVGLGTAARCPIELADVVTFSSGVSPPAWPVPSEKITLEDLA